MQFVLEGADARFPLLRRLLEEDGHRVGAEGALIAPPAARRGLPYYKSEVYTLRNAALTAEAAASLLMQRSDRMLLAMRVLVVGYGRIGSLLARRLAALGAAVTVASRGEASRARVESDALRWVDITQIDSPYDAVVNTVPAPVLRGDYGGALCLDLASAPGGWADDTPVLRAPGLPALYAPGAAAELLRDAVYEAMKEDASWND